MKTVFLNSSVLCSRSQSITDTLDTAKIVKRGLLVPTNYAKDILGNLSKGMCSAWCMMSPTPTFQNASLPLAHWVIDTHCIVFTKST